MIVLAIVSAPDAMVIAALVAAAGTNIGSWLAAHRAAKQTKPNGGASLRDAVDRIEVTLMNEVVPRLDRGATVMADHADRLAVLEARPPDSRTRSTDRKAKP